VGARGFDNTKNHPPTIFMAELAEVGIGLHVSHVKRWLCSCLVFSALAASARADENGDSAPAIAAEQARVVVVPVRAMISKPELYILRRGIRQAIDSGADTLILDMNTPGGSVAVTLEIMEALDRFPGRTITYINREAISAGAIIAAVTDEIYFAPGGIIGAAEMVMGTGQDVPEALKRKFNSYLGAKIRAIGEKQSTRADVIRAMMDADFELMVGEEVIKPKGELLSLTATEAVRAFGDPPVPLLAAGIEDSIESLVKTLHGKDVVMMDQLQVTWSEKLAQYLVTLTPLLMGIGMVFLFIEFKTPGFGVFGLIGGLFLGVVFFGHYVAGLSGYEPVIIFVLGVVLVLLEVLFFPGMLVGIIAGMLMILGSLLWAMADFLPDEPITFSSDLLLRPLFNLVSGVFIAVLIFLAIVRFLPRGGLWGRMVLATAVAGEPRGLRPLNTWATPGADSPDAPAASLIGQSGKATTGLFPSGQVEVDGRRYEARLEVGTADPGTPVKVIRETEFALIVEVES